jgi:hypothetical protein
MAKGAVRPEALAAGAVTMVVMAVLYNRAANRCTEFNEIWKESGPIHLKQEVQDSAFEHAALKLRSVDAAGQEMSVLQLRDYLLEMFEPKCEWKGMESERGKTVLQSFTDIARYSLERFYGGDQINGGA